MMRLLHVHNLFTQPPLSIIGRRRFI